MRSSPAGSSPHARPRIASRSGSSPHARRSTPHGRGSSAPSARSPSNRPGTPRSPTEGGSRSSSPSSSGSSASVPHGWRTSSPRWRPSACRQSRVPPTSASASRRSAHGSARSRQTALAAVETGRGLLQQTQEQARRQAKLELELEAIEERLRLAGEEAREGGWRLADRIEVDRGYETALAAALGGRLGARVVASVAEAAAAVERAGDGGTRALVSGGSPTEAEPGAPPAHGAERLSDRVRPASELRAVVDRLLARAWVVERIADVPDDFAGIAVTRAGVAYDGASREAWRVPEGGAERAIAERARREELHTLLERAARRSPPPSRGDRPGDARRARGRGTARRARERAARARAPPVGGRRDRPPLCLADRTAPGARRRPRGREAGGAEWRDHRRAASVRAARARALRARRAPAPARGAGRPRPRPRARGRAAGRRDRGGARRRHRRP